MDMRTLHLMRDEKAVFAKLPPGLREGWRVEDETLKSFESLRQIQMRYAVADFKTRPALRAIVDRLKRGEKLETFSLDDLPPDTFRELAFVMGARGVNGLMHALVRGVKDDDDIELLAYVSSLRHKLLELNAHATHK